VGWLMYTDPSTSLLEFPVGEGKLNVPSPQPSPRCLLTQRYAGLPALQGDAVLFSEDPLKIETIKWRLIAMLWCLSSKREKPETQCRVDRYEFKLNPEGSHIHSHRPENLKSHMT
jgi:hypothetical protein